MATSTGLEPATSCVTGRRSNQLNYEALIVPDDGIELSTYRLQGGCSTTELIRLHFINYALGRHTLIFLLPLSAVGLQVDMS
jgi:hypothetical protein